MSAKDRRNRDGSQKLVLSGQSLDAGERRSFAPNSARLRLAHRARDLGEPGAASAGCSDADRTISSSSFPGPILATGGDITVDAGASVAGGPTGVYAQDCGIGVLSNSGAIDGGAGALGVPGGVGVRANSDQTINSLSNAAGATISGGDGGSGPSKAAGGAGGAGVSNFGTVTNS